MISEESKCEGDVKKALKAVEQYLQQSGLYYESTNNGDNNSRRYNPNNTMSGNSFKDSLMSKPVNGNMENNGNNKNRNFECLQKGKRKLNF